VKLPKEGQNFFSSARSSLDEYGWNAWTSDLQLGREYIGLLGPA